MYFGCSTDDGNFTPDENALYVRKMVQLFADGMTAEDISRGLEGVKNSQERPIKGSQVRSILKNEIYKGMSISV